MNKFVYLLFAFFVLVSCSKRTSPGDNLNVNSSVTKIPEYNNLKGLVPDCADPFILKHQETYYLYGTGGNDGIRVYVSEDMVNWTISDRTEGGYALHKNDVWGEKWFWAPEVYHLNDKFYMFYTAEERIAVAESTTPFGPFKQSEANKKPFHVNIPEIDTHLFIDDDGKKYLYFVRFTNGNEIWAAELSDDMYSVKESTLVYCFGASQEWENSKLPPFPGARVNEGPFMLKHKGLYYLTYSANHYQNADYGVGYATSNNPLGPWKKYDKNPILTGNDKIQGVGHHSFVKTSEGCDYIVYHTHLDMDNIHPRKVGIDTYKFVPTTAGEPDILVVNGPTTEPQKICRK